VKPISRQWSLANRLEVDLGGPCVGEAVAGGAGFDDVAVVGEPVDDGGAQPGVGEGLGPAGERLVGGDADAGAFLAFGERRLGAPAGSRSRAGRSSAARAEAMGERYGASTEVPVRVTLTRVVARRDVVA
jgi:hypothetical protein